MTNQPHTPTYTSKRAAFLVSVLALCGSALAQSAQGDAWRFQVTPYLWMTGLEGHIRPYQGAPLVHVDKSFSDVLDKLDAAVFVSGTARKGRWVLQGDFSHAASSDSARLPYGLTAQAKLRQTSMTMTGGYNWQIGQRSSVDLLGGLRLWDIQAQVRVPGVAQTQSHTFFADPVVAVRWRYDIAPRWSSLVYADAGGLGIGSDATWQMLGTLNYQWREQVHVSAGYRHLHVNYRHSGKRLDFSQGGPLLGLTFRF